MSKNKLLSVPLLIAIDILLIGVGLCVFALFHHVLPSIQQANVSQTASSSSTLHVIASSGNEQSVSVEPTVAEAVTTTLTDESVAPEASASATQTTATIETSATYTATATATATPAPTEQDSLFTDGEVISTETTYKSANVSITVTEYDINGVVYYVQDIYIKNVENLKTAFAQDSYGKGIRDTVLNMATENNAIAAINGDYYGTSSSNGVVIRNGVLYRSNPTGDVLVMFYDGTMAVYSESAFDADEVMAQGAYQAWCFGPSLLNDDGTAVTSFSVRGHVASDNPRTGIGYFEPGHYCFVTVDGRSDASEGVSLKEFAALFESLGCKLAYNLDGGKTSVMTFGDEIVNVPVSGGRTSSDIIYITE